MNESVISRIMGIQDLPAKELQQKYEELFQGQKPPSNNRIYLWKRIAFRLQELEYGGLAEETKTRLYELIQEFDPINHMNKQTEPSLPKKKYGRDHRLPIPGTILIKEYKGEKYEIKVLEKDFEFRNKTHRSLTSIAKEITGAHWNGYLFFSL